jgi:transposase-like protein
VAEVEVTFAVFTHEPFRFQEIAGEVSRMRRLGMSLRAIGRALGVDEKTVRKVLRGGGAAAEGSGSAKKI